MSNLNLLNNNNIKNNYKLIEINSIERISQTLEIRRKPIIFLFKGIIIFGSNFLQINQNNSKTISYKFVL